MTGGNTICRALPKVKTAAVLKSVTATTIRKSKWHKNVIDLASTLWNGVKAVDIEMGISCYASHYMETRLNYPLQTPQLFIYLFLMRTMFGPYQALREHIGHKM